MSASAFVGAPVIGQSFVSPNAVELVIVKRGRSSDKLDVRDGNGNIKLKVVDHFFSKRRELLDTIGNILITLKPKSFTLHDKWSVYRGESTNSEDLLFTFKRSKRKTLQYVFLGGNEGRGMAYHDYRIEGTAKSCFIYGREANNMVAEMNKKDNNYMVTVFPNVDYAFIVAIIAIITIIDGNIPEGGGGGGGDGDGPGDGGGDGGGGGCGGGGGGGGCGGGGGGGGCGGGGGGGG